MRQVFALLVILTSLAGCSSKSPFDMAQQGPTMKENYHAHMAGGSGQFQRGEGVVNHSIRRELENDINYQAVEEFGHRRLANPELEMFIYPRRSNRHGVIIPSHSIRFPMYERVHYGLMRDIHVN